MRLPRLRIRLRTLPILVALAALTLGAWQMWRRLTLCLERARMYADLRSTCSTMLQWIEVGELREGPLSDPVEVKRLREMCGDRAAGYRYVADRPWLPLPGEPEVVRSRPARASAAIGGRRSRMT